ncbi:MAG: hypothetical protein IPJ74_08550 [Saprospiraceae bacterium]|nr:hypothetical protein [Saprospiraceae bacterium]
MVDVRVIFCLYIYDFLDRLRSATFDEINESNTLRGNNWYNTSYQYDARGNFSKLNRKGVYWSGTCWQNGVIDSLSYTNWWNSNRLQTITDAAPSTYKDYGFKQNGTEEYQYDANGNLIFDPHKDMDVVYNFLNLPERIEFAD